MVGSSASRWARAATSGTTPPKGACRSTCEAITLARRVKRSSTMPTAVSSQDVSIPNTNTVSPSLEGRAATSAARPRRRGSSAAAAPSTVKPRRRYSASAASLPARTSRVTAHRASRADTLEQRLSRAAPIPCRRRSAATARSSTWASSSCTSAMANPTTCPSPEPTRPGRRRARPGSNGRRGRGRGRAAVGSSPPSPGRARIAAASSGPGVDHGDPRGSFGHVPPPPCMRPRTSHPILASACRR